MDNTSQLLRYKPFADSILFIKEYVFVFIIANAIALPAGYYLMRLWLQDFAFKIELTVWLFIFAALLSLIVSLITLSDVIFKSASANPVESLRYE